MRHVHRPRLGLRSTAVRALCGRLAAVFARRGPLAAVCALLWSASTLAAQGSCNVNNRSQCAVGGNAAAALTLTIPTLVRLQLPSATIAIPAATGTDYAAGFGTPFLVPVTVRANRSWSLAFRATAANWTGTGPRARANKPAADLQWALNAGGPWTDATTAGSGIATGASGTGGTIVSLNLRVRYAWTLDGPGSYSLPLQLTITAP